METNASTCHQLSELVQEYSTLQVALLNCLVTIADLQAPDALLFCNQRTWRFSLLGTDWVATRHGSGVRFVSARDVIVDAHARISDRPDGVDGWRLSEYLAHARPESTLRLSSIILQSTARDLERHLEKAVDVGFLAKSKGRPTLYFIPSH